LGSVNTLGDRHNPAGTEKVMERAEREAERSRQRGASEADVPDRALHAMHDARGSGDHLEAAVLPVIGEAPETASNASRTPSNNLTPMASREDIGTPKAAHTSPDALESHGRVPPPTPPKDTRYSLESVADRRESSGGQPPPTPPKDRPRGRTFDKDLPLPPVATGDFSTSPARMVNDEMAKAKAKVNGAY